MPDVLFWWHATNGGFNTKHWGIIVGDMMIENDNAVGGGSTFKVRCAPVSVFAAELSGKRALPNGRRRNNDAFGAMKLGSTSKSSSDAVAYAQRFHNKGEYAQMSSTFAASAMSIGGSGNCQDFACSIAKYCGVQNPNDTVGVFGSYSPEGNVERWIKNQG